MQVTCPASGEFSLKDHLYRPGLPFSSEELQTMTHRGIMRHLIADVYTESVLTDSPELRAAGAHALLNPSLAETSILCGESAAWVHLGISAPERVSVMVGRHTVHQSSPLGVQVHRAALSDDEKQIYGPLCCTTALRTAGDLFCGIGVRHLRRALDLLLEGGSRVDRILQQWPAAHEPLLGRDEDVVAIGAEDESTLHQRWYLISQLMRQTDASAEELADTVMRIVSRTSWDHRRRERIRQLVNQCVSRRLPTVR